MVTKKKEVESPRKTASHDEKRSVRFLRAHLSYQRHLSRPIRFFHPSEIPILLPSVFALLPSRRNSLVRHRSQSPSPCRNNHRLFPVLLQTIRMISPIISPFSPIFFDPVYIQILPSAMKIINGICTRASFPLVRSISINISPHRKCPNSIFPKIKMPYLRSFSNECFSIFIPINTRRINILLFFFNAR